MANTATRWPAAATTEFNNSTLFTVHFAAKCFHPLDEVVTLVSIAESALCVADSE